MLTTLVVADHNMTANQKDLYSEKINLKFENFILPDTKIDFNLNYFVSPIEYGFESTLNLFDKFNNVVFLMDHNNYPVKILQVELERIYKKTDSTKIKASLDKNKMHFFGCSHTFGIGHSSKSTVYPSIMSSSLNIPLVNHGLPGKGNYHIENLMNNYTIKNTSLVVQLTDMYRINFMASNNQFISGPIYNQPKYANSVIFSEDNLLYNFKKIAERITNRLCEGDNKFLITYTYNLPTEYSIKCLEFLFEFKEFESLGGSVVDNAEDNQHYGIRSHALWAEKMLNKWNKLYR